MDIFDYTLSAELFHPTGPSSRSPLSFHRFETSAQAIKFAIEDLSTERLGRAVLEVNEVRYDAPVIRRLYESNDFPLARRNTARAPGESTRPTPSEATPVSNVARRKIASTGELPACAAPPTGGFETGRSSTYNDDRAGISNLKPPGGLHVPVNPETE